MRYHSPVDLPPAVSGRGNGHVHVSPDYSQIFVNNPGKWADYLGTTCSIRKALTPSLMGYGVSLFGPNHLS